MKKSPQSTRIAGDTTVKDWTKIKKKLQSGATSNIWKRAFQEFFKTRMETRYFQPIKAIEKMQENKGEGFAIVTLHCSVIEFLASTFIGATYKYQRKGKPPLGAFEYSDSREMFISLLTRHEPFKSMFANPDSAEDFYASVRCGLLHEARTKNGWKIQVNKSADRAIDTEKKVIYRNKMQCAFDQFIERYGRELSTSTDLQEAFIRKFDSLFEIEDWRARQDSNLRPQA